MKKIFSILLFLPLLTSCFKEDDPILPHGQSAFTVTESIYTHESFFDLATSRIVSVNPIEIWDLGFESSAEGWHIIINSGKYLGIYSSGTTGFETLASVPSNAVWSFDKSDGNLDSTALRNWLSPDKNPTNEVFVIGINDGIKYSPFCKVVFISLIADIYTFRYANLDGSGAKIFSIHKNPISNFVYFSFSDGGKEVEVEPPKNLWDFVFTQYSTTLYTDDGVPTPYFVRGVLSNRNGVEVALDSLLGYTNLTINNINNLEFSSKADAIGHDWKSVKIDGTDATYGVRPNHTYVIKSINGTFFKLRFTGFFNNLGSPGYPRFETEKL